MGDLQRGCCPAASDPSARFQCLSPRSLETPAGTNTSRPQTLVSRQQHTKTLKLPTKYSCGKMFLMYTEKRSIDTWDQQKLATESNLTLSII